MGDLFDGCGKLKESSKRAAADKMMLVRLLPIETCDYAAKRQRDKQWKRERAVPFGRVLTPLQWPMGQWIKTDRERERAALAQSRPARLAAQASHGLPPPPPPQMLQNCRPRPFDIEATYEHSKEQ